jgi:hypothetical protein
MTSFFGFFREGLSASPLMPCGSTCSPVIGLLAIVRLVPLKRRTPYPLSCRVESGGVASPEECPESRLWLSSSVDSRLGGVDCDAGP